MDDMRASLEGIFRDLNDRNLAIPAGILAVLIVAAIVLLPKNPAPPPAQTVAPAHNGNTVKRATVAQITLSDSLSLKDQHMRSAYPLNPFDPLNLYKLAGSASATGASGSTGGTEPTGGTTPMPTDPGDPGDGDLGEDPTYIVDVTFDGKTYSNLEAGESIPDDGTAIAYYAGASTSGKQADFLVADGITVQGATFDENTGIFTVEEGDNVVLTDDVGNLHTFKLKDISKK